MTSYSAVGKILAALTVLLGVAGFSPAAGPRYPEAFVTKPLKLMPEGLRTALGPHQSTLLSAYLEALNAPPPENSASAVVQGIAQAIQALQAERPSLADLAKRFGGLGALLARFTDLRTLEGLGAGKDWLEDFTLYRNSSLHKFVAVFYEHSPLLFVKGDPAAYLAEIRARNQAYLRQVETIYREGGNSRTFDDLSPAFGIASMHYSHTITDVANLWLYIWWKTGGDVANTPYWEFPVKPSAGR